MEASHRDPDKLTEYYIQGTNKNFQLQCTYLRCAVGSTWH
jgi:hypothetical protein